MCKLDEKKEIGEKTNRCRNPHGILIGFVVIRLCLKCFTFESAVYSVVMNIF